MLRVERPRRLGRVGLAYLDALASFGQPLEDPGAGFAARGEGGTADGVGFVEVRAGRVVGSVGEDAFGQLVGEFGVAAAGVPGVLEHGALPAGGARDRAC